jgi:hypothetical protein
MKKSVARAVPSVGPDLVSGRSVQCSGHHGGSGLTQGEALHEKSVARAVPGVGPDLVSGRSVQCSGRHRGSGLTQGEALP